MNHSTSEPNADHSVTANLQPGASLLSATSIVGDEVRNMQDESLGKIQDIMLDVGEGKIRYAVLSSGGFLGPGHGRSTVRCSMEVATRRQGKQTIPARCRRPTRQRCAWVRQG